MLLILPALFCDVLHFYNLNFNLIIYHLITVQPSNPSISITFVIKWSLDS